MSGFKRGEWKTIMRVGFDNDSVMQNPIGEADLKWILHHNCEGTEQL